MKERRKKSKPDSTISESEQVRLLTELSRPENHRPLEPELIQQIVRQEPQLGFLKFWKWMMEVEDDELALKAVNDNSAYRYNLASWLSIFLEHIDCSRLSDEALMFYIGWGAQNFRILKRYSGWEDIKYPGEPLPAKFITEQILKLCSFAPLEGYLFVILSIYLWRYFALPEAEKRATKHPALEGFLAYHTATDEEIRALSQELAPEGYQFSDKDQAWEKLRKAPKVEKGLKAKAARYSDVFSLRSEHHDVLKESDVEAEEALFEGVNYWKSRAYEAAIAGLKGYLGNSLLSIVEHNFVAAIRKEDPQFAKLWQKAQEMKKPKTPEERLKLLDMVKNIRDKIQWKEPLNPSDKELFNSLQEELISAITPLSLDIEIKDKDDKSYCLGDMIEDDKAQRFVEAIDEGIDLKSLGLNMDALTPKEILVLQDVYQGLEEGYSFDAKLGNSFRVRWGQDYGKNIKAYHRAKSKLKKL